MSIISIKKYRTLYADPPWKEIGGGRICRGANRHYKLMSTQEIIDMGPDAARLSDANAHLYLWVTNNHLPDGLMVMEAWGFRYVTIITWVKGGERVGLGQYFRGASEQCLFGVRGHLPYKVIDGKEQQGVTAFIAPRGKHSEKPDKMRRMIEMVSYPPYLELFARQEVPGWDVWGDEVQPSRGLYYTPKNNDHSPATSSAILAAARASLEKNQNNTQEA